MITRKELRVLQTKTTNKGYRGGARKDITQESFNHFWDIVNAWCLEHHISGISEEERNDIPPSVHGFILECFEEKGE
jgi:hypothetical protein